jgi:hypothetical protein
MWTGTDYISLTSSVPAKRAERERGQVNCPDRLSSRPDHLSLIEVVVGLERNEEHLNGKEEVWGSGEGSSERATEEG